RGVVWPPASGSLCRVPWAASPWRTAPCPPPPSPGTRPPTPAPPRGASCWSSTGAWPTPAPCCRGCARAPRCSGCPPKAMPWGRRLAFGAPVGWGLNGDGQTTVPAGLNDVVAVAAGGNHSLALRADGTVRAWGSNSFGQATVPAGLSNVVAVAAGYNLSLALK